jgi:2-polyprenyl-3-methyl-5-hydroxy-6-metoxy-1,4-benzoquinol methylase
MTLLFDPEENETRALFGLFDGFAGKSVLEIGCGNGRLTWRYARRAEHVTAIDMNADKLSKALANRSEAFDHVQFLNLDLESFATQSKEKFDIAILAWSL